MGHGTYDCRARPQEGYPGPHSTHSSHPAHFPNSHVAPSPLPSPLCTVSHLIPEQPHQTSLFTYTCATTPVPPSGCHQGWDSGMQVTGCGMLGCGMLGCVMLGCGMLGCGILGCGMLGCGDVGCEMLGCGMQGYGMLGCGRRDAGC